MKATILVGDVLERLRTLRPESVQCVVTSPPYWGLRDYGTSGQIGLEKTPGEFIAIMVEVFREVRRVLRSDGTCWVNMGDSYAGSWGAQSRGNTAGEARSRLEGGSPLYARTIAAHPLGTVGTGSLKRTPGLKPKDLCGIPYPMPESVTDRCTKAHEYIFLLTKSARYFYDIEAIKEPFMHDPDSGRNRWDTKDYEVPGQKPQKRTARAAGNHSHKLVEEYEASETEHHRTAAGLMKCASISYGTRNKRDVWEIATEAYPEAHFATFPTELARPCILAGTSDAGCCVLCGSPHERVIEKVDTGLTQKMTDGWAVGDWAHGSILPDELRKGEPGIPVMTSKTTGWKSTCECAGSDATTPCTVLDPFSGSGTTGVVALRHGRHYVGVELNPEYAEMSVRRIRGDRPLLNDVTLSQPLVCDAQLP